IVPHSRTGFVSNDTRKREQFLTKFNPGRSDRYFLHVLSSLLFIDQGFSMSSEANKSVATMAGLVIVAAVIVGIVMFFFFRSDETGVTESVPVVEPEQIPEPPITAPSAENKPAYEAPHPEPQEAPLPKPGESDPHGLSSLETLSDA